MHDNRRAGLWLSLLLAAAGLLAFVLHTAFLARGRREFRTAPSLAILGSTLVVSMVQAALTVREL